jgi:excisionase family DNA binding protein
MLKFDGIAGVNRLVESRKGSPKQERSQVFESYQLLRRFVEAPFMTIVSPYLTAPEAAAYLRTTVQGIYSLVKRGKVRPMPGSSKLLFTREALDAYLNGRFRR